jgi:DNA-binding protein H-NS
MNQPHIYMGKVGETVKYGWERHPRRGTVGPTQERDGRPIAMYHHLSTLGEMRLYFPFLEIEMAKSNLSSMSVDELLKLREDIGNVLSSKANELKNQLARLGNEIGPRMGGPRSSLKGRKAAIKYRDRSGNTWAGRGAHPFWLREKLKAGAKLEDFAVQKTVASRKASPRKSKKRRRAKR